MCARRRPDLAACIVLLLAAAIVLAIGLPPKGPREEPFGTAAQPLAEPIPAPGEVTGVTPHDGDLHGPNEHVAPETRTSFEGRGLLEESGPASVGANPPGASAPPGGAAQKRATPPPAAAEPLAGTTYYVAPGGDDGATGTLGAPFRTLNRAVRGLRPGDRLLVRGGTYAETLDNVLPSGISWAEPVTVVCYPGESATLRPPPGSPHVVKLRGPFHYIVLDGLNFDGSNVSDANVYISYSTSAGSPHHIRLQDCEIKNTRNGQGILVSQTARCAPANSNEFLRLKVHDNGTTRFHHGLYINSSYNLIDGCDIYRQAGEGIQIYKEGGLNGRDASHNTVRNNRVHDNGRAGMSTNIGIGIYTGDTNLAYNNVIWNNGIGIAVEIGAANTRVYNNTIDHNTGDGGIRVGYTKPPALNTTIRNNVISNNPGGAIRDYGQGTVADHNLLGAPNPAFVDASKHDFRLRADSPAVDAGVALPVVAADADGVPRPKGHAYDLGAYER